MKTIAIYDNTGKIFSMFNAGKEVPVGLQFVEFEVPQGYYVVSVDVANKQPIFKELPKNAEQIMEMDVLELRMAVLELTDLVLGGM